MSKKGKEVLTDTVTMSNRAEKQQFHLLHLEADGNYSNSLFLV